MIYPMIPWCPDDIRGGRDLGWAYNQFASIVPDDDWFLFMDGDALPTSTKLWLRLLEKAVLLQPDAGAFVPMTTGLNLQMSGWQMLLDLNGTHDLEAFYREGWARWHSKGVQMVDVTDIEEENPNYRPFSGVAFLIQKRTWVEIDGSPEGKMAFNDWAIHRKLRAAGKRVYLLPGWVVYHLGKALPEYTKRPRSMGGT
jgi:GT2 family glycosyltransferase